MNRKRGQSMCMMGSTGRLCKEDYYYYYYYYYRPISHCKSGKSEINGNYLQYIQLTIDIVIMRSCRTSYIGLLAGLY